LKLPRSAAREFIAKEVKPKNNLINLVFSFARNSILSKEYST